MQWQREGGLAGVQSRPPEGKVGEHRGQDEGPRLGLVVGCTVRLEGLKKATALNGRHGVLRRADPLLQGRWEVEFHSAESGQYEVKSIREENIVREDHATPTAGVDDGVPARGGPEGSLGVADPRGGPEEMARSGGQEAVLQPGCVVWVEGLRKATTLNGRQGIVSRPDPSRSGRWEVEFHAEGGDAEMRASIRQENLVLDTTADMDPGVQDDGYGDRAEALESPDKEDEEQCTAQEDADEAWEPDGFEAGAKVRIIGLRSMAARHLNDCIGTLSLFDPVSGRWQVRLQEGGIKSIRPENLSLEGATGGDGGDGGSGPEEHQDDEATLGVAGAGSNEGDAPQATPETSTAYADWDANEIAAAIVQSELDGDSRSVSELSSLLKARRAADSSLGQDSADAGPLIEECIEVPEEAVGFVIGQGGAMIHKLSADSGARLTITRPDAHAPSKGRICTIRGTMSEVAKAKQLVQVAVAESMAAPSAPKGRGKGKGGKHGKGGKMHDLTREGAGGRAGFEEGICKWYAAGFCRNRAEVAPGCCRNGLHNSEAAQRAEADWLGQGPRHGSTAEEDVTRQQPVLLLLDLEGGGNRDGRDGEDEIIEMPVLSMCPVTGRELGRFHRFVRPGHWDREAASMRQRFAPACFNATSNAVSFPEALSAMCSWICSLVNAASPAALAPTQFLFVTCGDWDVKTALPRQCSKPVPGTINPALQHLLFSRWCNLKVVFREHYRLPPEEAPTGMRGMLRRLRLPLAGQHHLGMDDVSNLAKVLKRVIAEGCRLEPTGHTGPSPAQGHPSGYGKGKCAVMGMRPDKGKGKGKEKGTCKGKGHGCPKGNPSSLKQEPRVATGLYTWTCTATPVAKALSTPHVDSVAAGRGSPMAGSLDDFLYGAPLPGGSWHHSPASEDDDEEGEADEREADDPGCAGDNSAKSVNAHSSRELGAANGSRHPPKLGGSGQVQGGAADACIKAGGKRLLGPAGLLAGVLPASPPRSDLGRWSEGGNSPRQQPAKRLKPSTLLAGLPEPATRRSGKLDDASTISSLLESLPAPKAAAPSD